MSDKSKTETPKPKPASSGARAVAQAQLKVLKELGASDSMIRALSDGLKK